MPYDEDYAIFLMIVYLLKA